MRRQAKGGGGGGGGGWEGVEGWSDGKRTDRLARRRGADQFSPPAYQSCPLTLSVSADDTLSLPIGPFPGQEREKKV